jgi:hypothetical protein
MVWHILRKDLLLLWPFALTLVISQATNGAMHSLRQYFPGIIVVSIVFPFLELLGIWVLTIVAIQQDSLTGDRQDWLVRPIKRGDLLLAKVLCVLLLINLPIFALDIGEVWAQGFSAGEALGGALSRQFSLLVLCTAPAFLLGATTGSLVEALLFGGTVAIGCTLIFALITALGISPSTADTGVAWIPTIGAYLVVLIGTAATLSYQFKKRPMRAGRALSVVVLVTAVTVLYLPFEPSFAVQGWVSRSSPAQPTIELQFQPDKSRATLESTSSGNGQAQPRERPIAGLIERAATTVRLPMVVSGLPRDTILLADLVTLRLIDSNGVLLYRGIGVCANNPGGMGSSCYLNTLEVNAAAGAQSDTDIAQILKVPAAVYARVKDRTIRVEIDYALTVFNPRPRVSLGTSENSRRIPGLGTCKTELDGDGDAVMLACITPSQLTTCLSAMLYDKNSEKHNPVMHTCVGQYSPFAFNAVADVLNRVVMELPFNDPTHVIHFPLDSTPIDQTGLMISMYEAGTHFNSRILIPAVRLGDWEKSTRNTEIPQPAVGFYRRTN